MSDIGQAIVAWIGEAAKQRGAANEITLHTRLLDDQVLSSVELLNLTFFIEERFDAKLDPAEFVPENFETPNAVMAMVERSLET